MRYWKKKKNEITNHMIYVVDYRKRSIYWRVSIQTHDEYHL